MFMDVIKNVKEWFCFKQDGTVDLDKTSQLHFLKTLNGRESSFAVIGIRCNDKKSTGKRKMDPKRLYQLFQGYHIYEDRIMVDCWREGQNTLYDDYYTELNDGKPHIQISAIVGQNGAGKSSIVEFMMRLINNFAASTIGEKQTAEAAERLHYIDKIDGELWYVQNGYPYHLIVKNSHVKLSKYCQVSSDEEKQVKVFSQETLQYDNHGDECCEKLESVLEADPHINLKVLYENFFYTLVSNQSCYAYNTRDFYKECNDNEKENRALELEEEQTFDVEERCWLHGIFHKNDGYKTPIVVTPYRYEGNFDINKENHLAIERLVALLASQKTLRMINDHLKAKQVTYSYDPEVKFDINRVRKIGFKKLTDAGYQFLREQIVASWDEVLGKKISGNDRHRNYYEQAIDYIVYKTLKVSRNYDEHHQFYENNKDMTDDCAVADIDAMVKKLVKDHSHITRKIFQTIAYLWYNVYELEEKRNEVGVLKESSAFISFGGLGVKWHEKAIREPGVERDRTRNYIQRQALMVPPFLGMKIDLCEENKPYDIIDFATLSSGEKQQIYSISSILYHLDNLKSAQDDKSSPDRIIYNYVNVVLEEIELYYHPELQQQFVKYLIDGLDQMNLEGIKGIHVMIVTHSPYVLSDIPNTNVLALRKDDPEPEQNLQTFGANIHDLLKNSFFLKNGSIGKFAQWEVGHLLACMDVHRWALENKADLHQCPYVEEENPAYSFLQRYTYSNMENKKHRQFSYEYFNNDLSMDILKGKILMIDEPVLQHVLMRKWLELEALVEK